MNNTLISKLWQIHNEIRAVVERPEDSELLAGLESKFREILNAPVYRTYVIMSVQDAERKGTELGMMLDILEARTKTSADTYAFSRICKHLNNDLGKFGVRSSAFVPVSAP